MARKSNEPTKYVTGVLHISLDKIYDMTMDEIQAYIDIEFETVKMALIVSLAEQGYGNVYYDERIQHLVDADVRNRN